MPSSPLSTQGLRPGRSAPESDLDRAQPGGEPGTGGLWGGSPLFGRRFGIPGPRDTSGYTLLELLTAMLVLGLLLGKVYPAGGALLDRMAVQSAREGVVGLFHQARMEAVAYGGVRVLVDAASATLSTVPAGASSPLTRLVLAEGVTLTLSNNRSAAELNFDALGIGRVANQTLRFSRGVAEAELVVSSFGRLTRR